MPVLGLTRCGRKAPPSVSLANSGAIKALAARRLALRRLDCLRFGLAMGGSAADSLKRPQVSDIKTRVVRFGLGAVKSYSRGASERVEQHARDQYNCQQQAVI